MRSFFGRTDGAVALEMALVSPMLLLLMFGIYDFGTLLVNAMEVEHATQAAADYAYNQFLANGSAPSLAQIQSVTEAQSLPITMSISSDSSRPGLTWTGCPDSTGTSVQTATTCAVGLGTYLSIVGSAPSQSMIGAWTGFPTNLATKIMIRLQ